MKKFHFNTRIFDSYLRVIEKERPDIDLVKFCDEIGLPLSYIRTPDNWVSAEFEYKFTKACLRETGIADLDRKAGAFSLSRDALGPLLLLLKALPRRDFYGKFSQHAKKMNQVVNFSATKVKEGLFKISLSINRDLVSAADESYLKETLPHIMENIVGIFEGFEIIKGGEKPTVTISRESDEAYQLEISYAPTREFVDSIRYGFLFLVFPGIVLVSTSLGSNQSLFVYLISMICGAAVVRAVFTTKKEINTITDHSFSQWDNLNHKYKKLLQMHEKTNEFVPWEIMRFLRYESVLDAAVGDAIKLHKVVMFIDIKGFTSISRTMSPQELFEFLSRYVSIVSPLVEDEFKGTIEKYMGDGIFAIFDEMGTAIAAAREVVNRLWQIGIEVRVGITQGEIIAGTIGYKARKEIAVIGETVNLASRLEELCKAFDASIIVDEGSWPELRRKDFEFRRLGNVFIRGYKATNVIEILSPGARNSRHKVLSKLRFEEAVGAYEDGDKDKAFEIFSQLMREHPQDAGVAYYLKKLSEEPSGDAELDRSA